MNEYTLILSKETLAKAENYVVDLNKGQSPGFRLREQFAAIGHYPPSPESLIAALLHTKPPLMFAESAVRADGTDWTPAELSILGDLSIGMDVTVFDNGRHRDPQVHPEPFEAKLVYTPGALLRNDLGKVPADWPEVVVNDTFHPDGYYSLYERRLLPALLYANHICEALGKKGLVTIPGLGCGAFAGRFEGRLGTQLQQVLARLLKNHHARLPHIRAVYYDPYLECKNERLEFGRVSLLVRPLLQGNETKPQLCRPARYAEQGDDFTDLHLISIVAWDHVSWPGNDFYGGSRSTDDGVKAAATDSMAAITGRQGRYDAGAFQYRPPEPYTTWLDLVRGEQIMLKPERIWLQDRFL